MSKQANPTAIGAFVLGALVLVIAAVLIFGSGTLFQQRDTWVVYFNESVTGLDRGAPVMFRGVPVGTVRRIEAIYKEASADIQIPVYLEFPEATVRSDAENLEESQRLDADDPDRHVRALIKRGLRAQLSTQSLVTGKLYVSLDLLPDTEAVFRAPSSQTVPEIPTVPSAIEQVSRTIQQALNAFNKLPLEEIGNNLVSSLSAVEALLSDPGLKQAIAESGATVVAVRDLARKADGNVGTLANTLETTADQATETLTQIDNLVEVLTADLGAGSPIQFQLMTTLQDVSAAARSLRTVADMVSRQPDALIFGRQPAEEN